MSLTALQGEGNELSRLRLQPEEWARALQLLREEGGPAILPEGVGKGGQRRPEQGHSLHMCCREARARLKISTDKLLLRRGVT